MPAFAKPLAARARSLLAQLPRWSKPSGLRRTFRHLALESLGGWTWRSDLVLALMDDPALRRYNDRIYRRVYGRGRLAPLQPELFDWEHRVLQQYFPGPPARLLVAGAGGGREVLVLARRGYQVVAFEPSAGALRGLRARLEVAGLGATALRGGFEDLVEAVAGDRLDPAWSEALAGGFDGVIAGWGSLTHLLSEADRRAALQACAGVLRPGAPLLVSYLCEDDDAATARPRGLRGWLARLKQQRHGRARSDWFAPHAGYLHVFEQGELSGLARAAGLETRKLWERGVDYPHALLRRPDPDA